MAGEHLVEEGAERGEGVSANEKMEVLDRGSATHQAGFLITWGKPCISLVAGEMNLALLPLAPPRWTEEHETTRGTETSVSGTPQPRGRTRGPGMRATHTSSRIS